MTLIELVKYFRENGSLEKFQKTNQIDPEVEVIEICMEKPIQIDSQLCFFNPEITENKTDFIYKDKEYQNLIDFFYFEDFIEESKGIKDKNNKDLAELLFKYAINDA
jgi:hypothetical protein